MDTQDSRTPPPLPPQKSTPSGKINDIKAVQQTFHRDVKQNWKRRRKKHKKSVNRLNEHKTKDLQIIH